MDVCFGLDLEFETEYLFAAKNEIIVSHLERKKKHSPNFWYKTLIISTGGNAKLGRDSQDNHQTNTCVKPVKEIENSIMILMC